MARDGTNRGGRRVRAGDKPLPLVDKIAAGKAARILEPANLHPEELLEPAELTGAADMYATDRLRLRRDARPHAERSERIRARAGEREVAFVVARLCICARRARLDQSRAQAARVERDGEARANQATAGDDDVEFAFHAAMIRLARRARL